MNGDSPRDTSSGSSTPRKSTSKHSTVIGEVSDTSYGPRHISLLGDLKSKNARTMFKAYVDRITSAQPYAKDERSAIWFKRIRGRRRTIIYKKLERVDPEGLKKLKAKLRMLNKRKKLQKKHKFVPTEKDMRGMEVLVEQEKLNTPSASVLRYVPAGGIQKALSLVRAAGYTPDETAAIFNMKPEDVNAIATPESVKAAKREVPEAVRLAADGYVLRDLLKGKVDTNTEIADRISARRTKLILDASAEGRAIRGEDKALEEKREKELSERFGVDRKKGEVIEIKEEK